MSIHSRGYPPAEADTLQPWSQTDSQVGDEIGIKDISSFFALHRAQGGAIRLHMFPQLSGGRQATSVDGW